MNNDPSNVSGTCPPSRLGQLEEENARLKAEVTSLEERYEGNKKRRAKYVADAKYPETGDRFRHWKGGVYEVLGTAFDVRDGRALTLYRDPLDQFRRVWARPTV